MNKIKISEYVSARRKKDGLNLRDFGERYNISKSQVDRYEKGDCDKPSVLVAKRFCNTFDIDYDAFIADFDYDDSKNILINLGSAVQIEQRLTRELSDTFSSEVAENYFNIIDKKYGNTEDFFLTDYYHLPTKDNEGIYIERQAEFTYKGEKVYILYFIRPFLFPNKCRSINYSFMNKMISSACSYSEDELGSKNFIFIVPSKDAFNFFSTRKFNETPNNAILVLVRGSNDFIESTVLYGQNFLEKQS